MSSVSLSCGLPFCDPSQEQQLCYSKALKVAAVFFAVISILVGVGALTGTLGLQNMGSLAGKCCIAAGAVLLLTGLFVKCVQEQPVSSGTASSEDFVFKTSSAASKAPQRVIIPLMFDPRTHPTPAAARESQANTKIHTAFSMNDFSVVAAHPHGETLRLQALRHLDGSVTLTTEQDRAMAMMLGMACGDAIGAPFEFLNYSQQGYNKQGEKIHMTRNSLTGAKHICIRYSRDFHLSPGKWTDDTSMGLCLADTLIQQQALDDTQLMWAFIDWWEHGYNNAFTQGPYLCSVGRGGNIGQAFDDFTSKKLSRAAIGPCPTKAGTATTSGNGSLMRNCPVAIFATTEREAMELAYLQSKVTHQGNQAAACCQLMAFFLFHALHSKEQDPRARKQAVFAKLAQFSCRVPTVNLLAKSLPDLANGEDWNWQASGFKFHAGRTQQRPDYIGSYAMDALAMALHCVFTTDSFEDAVCEAIRHGGDADTVGAITGQLAGSLYGARAIPKDWVDSVQQWDRGGEIAARALLLNELRTAH